MSSSAYSSRKRDYYHHHHYEPSSSMPYGSGSSSNGGCFNHHYRGDRGSSNGRSHNRMFTFRGLFESTPFSRLFGTYVFGLLSGRLFPVASFVDFALPLLININECTSMTLMLGWSWSFLTTEELAEIVLGFLVLMTPSLLKLISFPKRHLLDRMCPCPV